MNTCTQYICSLKKENNIHHKTKNFLEILLQNTGFLYVQVTTVSIVQIKQIQLIRVVTTETTDPGPEPGLVLIKRVGHQVPQTGPLHRVLLSMQTTQYKPTYKCIGELLERILWWRNIFCTSDKTSQYCLPFYKCLSSEPTPLAVNKI